MTEDNRRLSDTAVDILSHLVPGQEDEHQTFSRDSLGMHPIIHPCFMHLLIGSIILAGSLAHALTHSPTHSLTH